MAFDSAQIVRLGGSWDAMGSLVASDGSGSNRYLQRLTGGYAPMRDLADAVHYVCLLHGRHPGMVDYACDRAQDPLEREWLEAAADAFQIERAYLVRIVAAAGPLPSTPGHAEAEAAALSQRHALGMLSQSDRRGCAVGAALALVIDWTAIRQLLDTAADRFGIDAPASMLPLAEETVSVVDALARDPRMERAMLFGAQQLFAQHRGLWELIETRMGARERC